MASIGHSISWTEGQPHRVPNYASAAIRPESEAEKLALLRSKAASTVQWSWHPETFRLTGYACFWLMLLLGILVSKVSVSEEQIKNSQLIQVFGYNNVCVYIDYEPSRTVAATAWIFAEYALVVYCSLNTLGFHFLYKQRRAEHALRSINPHANLQLTDNHMRLVWAMLPLQLILIPLFRLVFVESPAQQGMLAHYLPFCGLQWALTAICIQNYWYHKVDRRVQLPTHAGLTYTIGLILLTVLKQAFTLGAIMATPIWCSTHDEHGNTCTTGAQVAQFIDILWMVLAAVTPMSLAYYARRNTPPLRITISMPDTRFEEEAAAVVAELAAAMPTDDSVEVKT